MTRSARCLTSLLACAGALVLGGCSMTGDERLDAVRNDATPNLDTLYQRPADVDNALTVMADENGRMFWQDLGRVLYVDRPSRLTREPVPRP
jgi:hypothetical protein